MSSLGRIILVAVVLAMFGGCTFHFKASELEVDAERQRVQGNTTYELEKVAFLHGEASR